MLKSFLTPVTKRHTVRKVLGTHPLHLFRIVQDVDDYKNFLPLGAESKIIRLSPDGRSFDGALTVAAFSSLFAEHCISRISVIPETLTIQTESFESTHFESLRSRWKLGQVEVNDEACCDVNFEVEMTASNPVIVNAPDRALQQIAGRQVGAFEKRCLEIAMPTDLIEAAKVLKQ
jgi:ribosome-associated toxin RatA of RatAB toxin-antitoxin module